MESSDNNQFSYMTGIAVDQKREIVYAPDLFNNRVIRFLSEDRNWNVTVQSPLDRRGWENGLRVDLEENFYEADIENNHFKSMALTNRAVLQIIISFFSYYRTC